MGETLPSYNNSFNFELLSQYYSNTGSIFYLFCCKDRITVLKSEFPWSWWLSKQSCRLPICMGNTSRGVSDGVYKKQLAIAREYLDHYYYSLWQECTISHCCLDPAPARPTRGHEVSKNLVNWLTSTSTGWLGNGYYMLQRWVLLCGSLFQLQLYPTCWSLAILKSKVNGKPFVWSLTGTRKY